MSRRSRQPPRQLTLGLKRTESKILHAADLHLDSPLRGLVRYEGAPIDEIRGATRRAFDQLIDLALSEKVELLLLAGDLYDGDWRDYGTGLFFASRMQRLRDEGIEVVVVRGNHDAQSRITRALRLPENVHELSTEEPATLVFDRLGVAVHGQSYPEGAVSEDLTARYPAPVPGMLNFGLLHTSLEGREGHAPYAPTTAQKLIAKGYDYWALGHVHQREVVSREPWIVFPGNLQGRHGKEPGPKGATLVSILEGEITAVEPRVLDVVRWDALDIDASQATDVDAVLERVERAIADRVEGEDRLLALRVRIRGTSPAHRALLADAARMEHEVRLLASGAMGKVWIERVELSTKSAIDFDRLAEGSGPIADLLAALRSLPSDPEAEELIARELREFKARLPERLRAEPGLDRDERAIAARLAPELEQLLIPLLLESEVPR